MACVGHGLTLHSLQREPAHYLGYVYFRQVKDSSMKRGYFQKVSCLPLGGSKWWTIGGQLVRSSEELCRVPTHLQLAWVAKPRRSYHGAQFFLKPFLA